MWSWPGLMMNSKTTVSGCTMLAKVWSETCSSPTGVGERTQSLSAKHEKNKSPSSSVKPAEAPGTNGWANSVSRHATNTAHRMG